MTDSIEYRTLLASFDKLVFALRQNPESISNKLAALGLMPLPDDKIDAQQLTRRILDFVKVEPSRYNDVLKVLSKHGWLKDIVGILQTTSCEIL